MIAAVVGCKHLLCRVDLGRSLPDPSSANPLWQFSTPVVGGSPWANNEHVGLELITNRRGVLDASYCGDPEEVRACADVFNHLVVIDIDGVRSISWIIPDHVNPGSVVRDAAGHKCHHGSLMSNRVERRYSVRKDGHLTIITDCVLPLTAWEDRNTDPFDMPQGEADSVIAHFLPLVRLMDERHSDGIVSPCFLVKPPLEASAGDHVVAVREPRAVCL